MIGKADHRAAILWSIMKTEDFHTDLSVFAVHLIEVTDLTHCDWLLLRLFSFKSHIILILSDTDKCLFCLFLVSENIIQSFFDTVKLRNIIALFPTVHCMLIESGNKLLDSLIRNIRDLICHVVTNPPKGNVIKFFKGAVKESLSDLRISDLTLHTVKGAFYTVFAEISVKRVTEIFGIIISVVRNFTVLKNKFNIICLFMLHKTKSKLFANVLSIVITIGKVIKYRLTKMIAKSSLIIRLVFIKITVLKQRISHIFPFVRRKSTLRKKHSKVSLSEKNTFLLSRLFGGILSVSNCLFMFRKKVCYFTFLQSIMQNFIIVSNILDRESLVNAVDLSSCYITDKHSCNSSPLFIRKTVLGKEI